MSACEAQIVLEQRHRKPCPNVATHRAKNRAIPNSAWVLLCADHAAAAEVNPWYSVKRLSKPKPQHYKVACISLYNEDIERLETMVRSLKVAGYTKANKSWLIREALRRLDIDALPSPGEVGR